MSKPEDQNANDEDAIDQNTLDQSKAEEATDVTDLEKAKVDNSEPSEQKRDESSQEETEEVTLESLQLKLEQAFEETMKYKDVALRAEAEMQNVRRRATIDLENAHKFGIEKLVQNILPVVDGLEKA
ncbi:MAG: nucleotide exchange factor GrpE, partial [Pseudomonadales bacterium]|nr:nucleotide exchange factor GrpE [Pseudomonadales bacterium]